MPLHTASPQQRLHAGLHDRPQQLTPRSVSTLHHKLVPDFCIAASGVDALQLMLLSVVPRLGAAPSKTCAGDHSVCVMPVSAPCSQAPLGSTRTHINPVILGCRRWLRRPLGAMRSF